MDDKPARCPHGVNEIKSRCPWCEPAVPEQGTNVPNVGTPEWGAREWWIIRDPVTNTHTVHLIKPEWKSIKLGNERIHVIEKSAYDKRTMELAEMVLSHDLRATDNLREANELRKELARHQEAFEYLVRQLPEESTTGYVAHARAIASGDPKRIKETS